MRLSRIIIISVGHLRRYNIFKGALSFFELSTCNRLSVFKDIELIPLQFDEWPFFYYKRAVVATHSFKFTVFFSEQEELQQGDIIVINYDTSSVSGIYKLKDSLLFSDSNSSHLFPLWCCHYFAGDLKLSILSRALCFFRSTYCNHPLQQAICG